MSAGPEPDSGNLVMLQITIVDQYFADAKNKFWNETDVVVPEFAEQLIKLGALGVNVVDISDLEEGVKSERNTHG